MEKNNEKGVHEFHGYRFEEVEEFTHKIHNVILLSDVEKAKANGIRTSIKAFAKYVFAPSKDAVKSQVDEFKLDWKNGSIGKKLLTAVGALPETILNLGFCAAVTGVRAIDFFRRIASGKKFKEELVGLGMEEKLGKLLEDYYADETSLDPYSEGDGYASGAVIDIMDDLNGGRKR